MLHCVLQCVLQRMSQCIVQHRSRRVSVRSVECCNIYSKTHCNATATYTTTHTATHTATHRKQWFATDWTVCHNTITHYTMQQQTASHCCSTLQNNATHTAVHAAAHTATYYNTRCSKLQHTAVHCSALQHTTTRCNTLQHAATRCNALQRTATHMSTNTATPVQHTATDAVRQAMHIHSGYMIHIRDMQHTATLYNTHTATYCNMLQHTFVVVYT